MPSADQPSRSPAEGGSRGAVITFIAAVLLFSLLPLLVHYSVDSIDVLAFFVVWMLSELITISRIIKHLTRSSGTERPGIRSLWRDNFLENKHGISRPRLKTVIFVLLVLGGAFDWLLFGVAVENLGPSTATVLYEFWPTLIILGLALRPRNSTLRPRHERFTAGQGLLICLSCVGVTMVVLSQDQGSHGGVDGLGSAVGLAAAALAALWIVLTIRLSDWQRIGADDTLARMHLSMVVKYHRNLAAALVVAPAAIASLAQSRALSVVGLLLAVAGGAVGAFGDYFLFKANQHSRDLSINALANATPVLALVWLAVLVGVDIPRLDWFVFGTLAVITANTLLRLDPEGADLAPHHGDEEGGAHDKVRGWAYRSLVLSILAAGAFLHFRDSLLPEEWREWNTNEYWGVVAVCATVFVLILSFRISRIAERTRQEDDLMLELYRESEHYIEEEVFGPCPGRELYEAMQSKTHAHHEHVTSAARVYREDCRQDDACDILHHLREVNRTHKPHRMAGHYFAARRIVALATQNGKDVEIRSKLYGFQARLDRLANLRQSGREFAEMVSMVIFGFLTIFAVLFQRPKVATAEPSAWTGFSTELIAMMLASAVAFLIFNLFDKQGERDTAILRRVVRKAREAYGQPPGWSLNIAVYRDVTWHRRISAGVFLGVVAVMIWLLHHRWF